jgi:hypothetical protein
MKLSAILAPLIAAKVPHEVILQTVLAYEAEHGQVVEASKEKARARWRKWKATNVSKRLLTAANVDQRLVRADAPVEDKTSNLDIEPQKEEKKETRERASFDAFWAVYPHKVGKAEASKSFAKAIRRVDLETLMAGLRRYVAKTDDRPWCNPATWLNQDRWTDEPATVLPMARGSPINPIIEASRRLRAEMDAANAEPASQVETDRTPTLSLSYGGQHGR